LNEFLLIEIILQAQFTKYLIIIIKVCNARTHEDFTGVSETLESMEGKNAHSMACTGLSLRASEPIK
jgi:hypothetical protein